MPGEKDKQAKFAKPIAKMVAASVNKEKEKKLSEAARKKFIQKIIKKLVNDEDDILKDVSSSDDVEKEETLVAMITLKTKDKFADDGSISGAYIRLGIKAWKANHKKTTNVNPSAPKSGIDVEIGQVTAKKDIRQALASTEGQVKFKGGAHHSEEGRVINVVMQGKGVLKATRKTLEVAITKKDKQANLQALKERQHKAEMSAVYQQYVFFTQIKKTHPPESEPYQKSAAHLQRLERLQPELKTIEFSHTTMADTALHQLFASAAQDYRELTALAAQSKDKKSVKTFRRAEKEFKRTLQPTPILKGPGV